MSKTRKIAALLDEKIDWTSRCLNFAIKQGLDTDVQRDYASRITVLTDLKQELTAMKLLKDE